MPPKKSDILPPAHGGEAPSAWVTVLKSNWGIALALLLLLPLYYVVHGTDLLDSYTRRILLLVGVSIVAAVSLQLINGTSGQFSLGHAGFMAIGAYLSAYPMMTYARFGSNPLGVLLFYLALGLVMAIAGSFLLALFLLIRRTGKLHAQLPAALLLGVAAWFLWDISAAGRAAGAPPMYLVWTRGIAMLSDLFDAVAHREITFTIGRDIGTPLCFLLVLLGGGACASVAGLIVGLPTLRLRGDYLAIATLGFAEIIRVVINNSAPLGGATGLTGMARLSNFAWIYGAVIVTVVVVWRIVHSGKGRTLIAVREDEVAAGAVGIDATHYRVFAFVIGSFFAGVAGGLFAHLNLYLNPNEFGFLRSVELVVMVTLGGLGSISGAVVTAAVLTMLPEVLRGFAEWRMVLYALLLILMMLLRPQGLLGSRELWPPSRWWRRGPGGQVDIAPTIDAEAAP